LVQRIKDSNVSIQQAEKQTIDFLQAYVNPSASPMCGNTICQDNFKS
jgi:oligoribonuclease